ncbi:MAG TPA: pyridoxal 5'-phosphate synthase glutaminase subunit PdxT [Candidatus Marinimicrobia bacterium]|jgi:5'-phosphate synthase pdxT subunit|nr:pyridoxal 5'-phosphate synthase glutaminase subunit PdxT [Candidatus Neomarinimicrobiota bacterium]MDP7216854.1 pyridoxal 5'-phosphate synthase glutaminase subunit PdxT [Candidatus Neomarinimicrobiota bacterium]HBN45111.1 pyridoxal 5'-phosphate synthase glutaminase subunit PdxT [Candidatus Neomarinimicrobiota bacterium]HJL73835.1 pyridoxal 5'-phosphate synthase glutaminase subunit PdxT [Candidatus Neomarinimicrobiota bacterium]HJM69871.1 pyridoxal 5'-phosphate synthase glutaminase subunit Pd|tara:strand:- start:11870 stop:12469 length:600 start_codon:yes stop_codon:yes gene_type:complete
MKIGILALQGDYEKHALILENLEIESVFIRYPQELHDVDGLIIPGGESTTLTHLMHKNDFYNTIKEFAKSKPVLGTCAGLIMMANKVEHALVDPLGLMDIAVDRNAYGRQVHSFVDELPIRLNGQEEIISATFIRAPRISKIGKDVEILAEYNNEPCAVKQGKHIALSFHPELNEINIFHKSAFCKNEAIEQKESFYAA